MNIKLFQIGTVKKDANYSYIQLEDDYKKGLTALEGFSSLNILWWGNIYDTIEYRENTIIEKPYRTGPDKVGVFATRSPIRPNPILTTVVFVSDIDVKNGRIYIPYIDAEQNTPVLDIKPFFPCSDIPRDVATPNWCSMLPNCIEDSATFDWSSFFNFEE